MEINQQGVGRCKCAFWFAVFHDVLGLFILLTGVFWDVFFHDFIIYAGAVVIFLSLIWWVFWYTGNIEVPPAELEDDVLMYKRKKGISGVVRKVSSRLSNGLRSSLRKSGRRHFPNGTNGTSTAQQSSAISMIYMNTQPPQPAPNNLNREPLSI